MAKPDTKSDNATGAAKDATDTVPAAPTPTPSTEASSAPSPANIKVFRTLKGDIADMVAQSKISRKALAKLDKRLEKQVEEYQAAGGDEKVSEAIVSRESNAVGGGDENVTPEALPFVIRKIREAQGDMDDSNVSREEIVNEIEKDYSGGSGNDTVNLDGVQGPRRQVFRDQGPRVVRTVQGVMPGDKNRPSRTLEGETVYQEAPLPDMPRRGGSGQPIQVDVNINEDDLGRNRQPQFVPVYINNQQSSGNVGSSKDTAQAIYAKSVQEPLKTDETQAPTGASRKYGAPVPPPPQIIYVQTPPPGMTPSTPPPPAVPVTPSQPEPVLAPTPKSATAVSTTASATETKHEIRFTPTPPVSILEERAKQEKTKNKASVKTSAEEPAKQKKAASPFTTPASMPSPSFDLKTSAMGSTDIKAEKISDDIQKKFVSVQPITTAETKDVSLDDKVADTEAKMEELDTSAAGIKREQEDLNNQRASLVSSLDPIVAKEKDVENEENALDSKLDQTASPEMKREIEARRWEFEDEREKIEKDRWSVEQDIVGLDEKLKELARRQDKNTRDKKALAEKLDVLKAKQAAAAAKTEKSDLVRQLTEIKDMEKDLESQWKTLHIEYEKAEDSLNSLLRQEESVRSDIRRITTRESQTSRPDERHKLEEEERWKKEAERKQMAENEFTAEDEATKAEKLITDLQNKFQKIKSDELTLASKVKVLRCHHHKSGGLAGTILRHSF